MLAQTEAFQLIIPEADSRTSGGDDNGEASTVAVVEHLEEKLLRPWLFSIPNERILSHQSPAVRKPYIFAQVFSRGAHTPSPDINAVMSTMYTVKWC
jgi:hypothetical protein